MFFWHVSCFSFLVWLWPDRRGFWHDMGSKMRKFATVQSVKEDYEIADAPVLSQEKEQELLAPVNQLIAKIKEITGKQPFEISINDPFTKSTLWEKYVDLRKYVVGKLSFIATKTANDHHRQGRSGLSFADLHQQAIIGIIHAIDHHDGLTPIVSPYAYRTAVNEIRHFLDQNNNVVRVVNSVVDHSMIDLSFAAGKWSDIQREALLAIGMEVTDDYATYDLDSKCGGYCVYVARRSGNKRTKNKCSIVVGHAFWAGHKFIPRSSNVSIVAKTNDLMSVSPDLIVAEVKKQIESDCGLNALDVSSLRLGSVSLDAIVEGSDFDMAIDNSSHNSVVDFLRSELVREAYDHVTNKNAVDVCIDHLLGKSYDQIAKERSCSKQNVKHLFNKCIKQLMENQEAMELLLCAMSLYDISEILEGYDD